MTLIFLVIFCNFVKNILERKLCCKFPDFSKIVQEQKKIKCKKMFSIFLLEHIFNVAKFYQIVLWMIATLATSQNSKIYIWVGNCIFNQKFMMDLE
jgi:hypothetical protein